MSDTNTKSLSKRQIIAIGVVASTLFGFALFLLIFGENCTGSQIQLTSCAEKLRTENSVNSLQIEIYGKEWKILELQKDAFPMEQ